MFTLNLLVECKYEKNMTFVMFYTCISTYLQNSKILFLLTTAVD